MDILRRYQQHKEEILSQRPHGGGTMLRTSGIDRTLQPSLSVQQAQSRDADAASDGPQNTSINEQDITLQHITLRAPGQDDLLDTSNASTSEQKLRAAEERAEQAEQEQAAATSSMKHASEQLQEMQAWTYKCRERVGLLEGGLFHHCIRYFGAADKPNTLADSLFRGQQSACVQALAWRSSNN
eukprot:scaffold68251_cov36-Prasinocladus_malaysianus.AAC.1